MGLGVAAIWPSYMILLAYAARQGPWPRSVGTPVSAVVFGLALAVLVHGLLRWLARPAGWAESYLGIPAPVARQLGRAGRFVAVAATAFLLPVYLFAHGLIVPDARPISAPAVSRFLIVGFELVVWAVWVRLLRTRSALVSSLALEPQAAGEGSDTSRVHAGLVWLSRRRRSAGWLVLVAIASVIVLDVRGYSFSAHRLAIAGSQTAMVVVLCVAAYRAILRAIDQHAWRWSAPRRYWARALTSAVALRSSARFRGAVTAVTESPEPPDPAADALTAEGFAAALRHLAAGLLLVLGLWAITWL
jgi:potassium efflux system protein